jgi:hypothetical protein
LKRLCEDQNGGLFGGTGDDHDHHVRDASANQPEVRPVLHQDNPGDAENRSVGETIQDSINPFRLSQHHCHFQILDIIFFICILSGGSYLRGHPSGEWAIFVSMCAFWVTGILTIFYLVRNQQTVPFSPSKIASLSYRASIARGPSR